MQLLRIPSFIPLGPIRRRRAERVAALRAEDAKLQAARHARITAAHTIRRPQPGKRAAHAVRAHKPVKISPSFTVKAAVSASPLPTPIPIPQEIPAPEQSLHITPRPARSRGSYANDFSGRRMTTELSRADA